MTTKFRAFCFGFLCLSFAASAAATSGALRGKVKVDEVGAAGAMVTARALSSGIETTVFCGPRGEYQIDRLAPGGYQLEAKVPGKRGNTLSLELSPGEVTSASFALSADPHFMRRLPSARWLALLPEGEMRREFLINCASCHEISHDRIFLEERPRNSAEWLAAITLMRSIDVYGLTPPDFEDARYAEWLAGGFSREAVAGLRPAPGAEGPSLKARITEYPVPKKPSLPHDIALGRGRVWVTAFYNNVIWALDPDSGETRSYPVNEKPEVMGQVRALTFDPDGMLWVLLGGTESVVRMNPSDGAIQTFPVGMYPHSIEVDSQGKLWFNDYLSASERIGAIDPAKGTPTTFQVPSAGLTEEQGLPLLYGLQIDANDVVWGTMMAANKLFRFDTASQEARLFDMPQPNSGPRRPAVGPDGSIWIPEFNTGTLTRFDPIQETFSRHELGLGTLGPYDVEVDQVSGHVWVAASLGSALLRFDPETDSLHSYPLPTEPAYPRHIAIDGENGDVWTTYSSMPDAEPKIVRIQLGGERRSD